MRVETEEIEISRVYLSDSELQKIEEIIQFFSKIHNLAKTKDLQIMSDEIAEQLTEFKYQYC